MSKETAIVEWFGKSRTVPKVIYCNGVMSYIGEYDDIYTIVRRGECEYGLRNDGKRYLLIYDDELRQK